MKKIKYMKKPGSVNDITKNEGCVNKMLETLKDYKVTPVGLQNVIDDLKQIWK